MLAIMLGFGFCVFLNWMTVCMSLPELGKMLLGIESDFTRSPFALLNTTFLAAMARMTYLCVDPVLKTIYALLFLWRVAGIGEDLKAELKPFVNGVLKTTAAVIFFWRFFNVTCLGGITNAPAGRR